MLNRSSLFTIINFTTSTIKQLGLDIPNNLFNYHYEKLSGNFFFVYFLFNEIDVNSGDFMLATNLLTILDASNNDLPIINLV